MSDGQQREVTGGHWVGEDGRRPGGWGPWGTFMEARWGGGDTAGGCHLVQEPEEVAWGSGNGDGEKQVGLR